MLAFRIIVALLGLIAIFTGVNDLWNGANVPGDFGKHLGESVKDPTLNFTIRFLGAIWMGFGALLILFITDIKRYDYAIILAFTIIIIGGIGRFISTKQFGIEKGSEIMSYAIMSVELLLTPVLLIWYWVSIRNII
ncbi:DUF4345 family protein [Aquimarina latercula]|uniref:DUF4345 family protein n=1 Tax=Aquimarina latercula TaxID=987 RepID=UPI0003F62EF8|nr:DUF4345 family protein [Aquimarina latercula]